MKKRNFWPILLLCVCMVLLVWAYTQVQAVGSDLQYLIPAPAVQADSGDSDDDTTASVLPNAQAKALLEDLQTLAGDWDGIVAHYTFTGIVESASLTSDADETVQARLNALGPDAFLLTPKYLRTGRLFYPEELENGSSGILLDEQLALELFHVSEPVGCTVTIGDADFTVIGILRHTKQVGDSMDAAAYVPLAALWSQAVQLDALQVTASPVSGAGASAVFKEALESWQSGGTLIDLGKESMGAMLPLRVLLFFIGCVVLFWLLGIWKRQLRRFITDYKERLELEYAQRLMQRLLLGSLLLFLGFCALVTGAAGLLTYIVAPVYTFPEWVPAVPVEWDEIQTTFWQVWQSAASLRELRSPQLIRLRYFAMVTAWSSAGAAVAFTALWTKWRAKLK